MKIRPCHRQFPATCVVVLVALAGCLGSPAGPASPAETPTLTQPDEGPTVDKPGPADLDSVLYDLTAAENASAYADRHDLRLEGDRVEVRITLGVDRDLPATIDARVTARSGRRVVAYVPIDRLLALASHENTSSVSRVEQPQTG